MGKMKQVSIFSDSSSQHGEHDEHFAESILKSNNSPIVENLLQQGQYVPGSRLTSFEYNSLLLLLNFLLAQWTGIPIVMAGINLC